VVKTMIRFLKFTSWLLLRKVVQLSPIP